MLNGMKTVEVFNIFFELISSLLSNTLQDYSYFLTDYIMSQPDGFKSCDLYRAQRLIL